MSQKESNQILNTLSTKNSDWFGQWFNSPYYHILYKHRDDSEAQKFIDRLIDYFDFGKDDLIKDIACGKGRHAIYLNKKGYNVIGLDLSPQNIAYAKNFENERLKFYTHDMRFTWQGTRFDYILNLFTSFGYFQKKGENQQAINAIAGGLKKGGKILIDFLNPYTVINNLVPKEDKEIDGIRFHITKFLQENYIIKDIQFEDKGISYHFQERVKAIRRVDFLKYFKQAELELLDVFGDYNLMPYQAETSERMIFVLTK